MPRRDPAKAVQVLDMMLKFFDGGRRRQQAQLVSNDGQARCLVGALRHVRKEYGIRTDGTIHYLRDALEAYDPLCEPWKPERNDTDLMGFNDGSAFQEVREVIVEAPSLTPNAGVPPR
jgi:hypothetical protein